MDMDLFEKIVADYASIGGGYLGLSSMQSDLFSDKMLFDRLDFLQEFDNIVPYTTTFVAGAAKYTDEQLLKFLTQVKYIQVSLGGVDKDSYKSMYGINAFDTVKQQLDRIARLIGEEKLDTLIGLYFRTANKEAIEKSEFVRDLPKCFYISEIRDTFFTWNGIIEASDLPDGATLSPLDNTGKKVDCSVSWASLSSNVDGTVVGCGCVDWNSKHVVGDLKTHSITEIWNSEAAKSFRAGFSEGKIPEICKECSLYTPLDKAFSRPALANYQPTDGVYYLV